MTGTISSCRLDLLRFNIQNPRRVKPSDEEHKQLVASLKAHGLLQPLLVEPQDDGTFVVIDGGRRLKALEDLAHQGAWPADRLIAIHTPQADGSHRELGTAANMMRVAMHPLDECEAIYSLIGDDGVADTEKIAQRFGQTQTWVKQRLKLANLAPAARELFRQNILGLKAAEALTLAGTDEQVKYVRDIKGADDYKARADHIHRHFTERKIPARYALFELDAYPQQAIERDLFSTDVWLTDKDAFIKLQMAAIERHAEGVRKEGWAEVIVIKDGQEYEKLRPYVPISGRIKKAERAKLAAAVIYSPHSHEVRTQRGLALRKQAKKIAKGDAHAEDTAEARDVKPLEIHELSKRQQEQMSEMMATAIAEQCWTHESVALWTLIGPLVGVAVSWSRQRLDRGIVGENDVPEPYKSLREMELPNSLADFEALTQRDRMRLVRLASMLMVQACRPEPVLAEWDLRGWFRPNVEFLGGWRRDQLIAYGKLIGAETLIPEAKKTDIVSAVLAQVNDMEEVPAPLKPADALTETVSQAEPEAKTPDHGNDMPWDDALPPLRPDEAMEVPPGEQPQA